MKKLFVVVAIATFLIISIPISSHAAENGGINVCVDGEAIDFSSTRQEPISDNGRVLVPFRQVFESLGYTVTYDAITKGATVFKDEISVTIWQGKSDFLVNRDGIEETKPLDVSAKTTSAGRFVLPIRAVCQALGMKVEWDNDFRTIFVYSNEASYKNKDRIFHHTVPTIDKKRYDDIYRMYPVYTDSGFDKLMLMDIKGNILFIESDSTDIKLDSLKVGYSEGLYRVSRQEGSQKYYGVIDYLGNFIIYPDKYIYLSNFVEGYAYAGYVDESTGEEIYCKIDRDNHIIKKVKVMDLILSPNYRFSVYKKLFVEGYANALSDRNFYNEDGIPLLNNGILANYEFSEGIGIVENSAGKHGAIDTTGKLVIPCEFDYLNVFREGMAIAQKGSTRGFVNKTGQWVLKGVSFTGNEWYSEGYRIELNNSTKLTSLNDKNGKRVLQGTKSLVFNTGFGYLVDHGLFRVYELNSTNKLKSHGIMNVKGKMIIPCTIKDVNSIDILGGQIVIKEFKPDSMEALSYSYYDTQGKLLWKVSQY